MKPANAEAKSGVELKFVGPELGWRYMKDNDWLSPMLKACGDNIDIVGIHVYGFAAKDLTRERVLSDADKFRKFIGEIKARIAESGHPGMPLAITSASICYDWDIRTYTGETRNWGPVPFSLPCGMPIEWE